MGDNNNNGIGFQSNCESSEMSINPYFSSAWDQVESFGGSSMVSPSEFNTNPYQSISNYPSDYVEMLPKFPYGSRSFSEMAGSFGLTDCSQIAATCRDVNGLESREDHQSSEEPVVGNSPNGRGRKRLAESSSPKNELQKEHSSDVVKEQDEKKSRTGQNSASHSRGKQAVKPSKESSHSGEFPKENYIHVRARRGQATNSHSLAERVRREKISERMRLLQELVPGCNKITGKAVMLDEIINYVQSLQQQVEFLSMKLATVNPELNIDIDRILSKDILHSRGSNAGIMGLSPGMSVHPFSHGFFPANIPVIPHSSPQFPSVPHTILENDLQNLLQMGFDSSSAIRNLGPSGRLKPEM